MTSVWMAQLSGLRWALCKCWLFENIFVPQYGLHLHFQEYPDFVQSYCQLFTNLGLPSSALDDAFRVAQSEHVRRKEAELKALENKMYNLKTYTPLSGRNAFLLQKSEDFVEPFHRLCQYAGKSSIPTEDMLSVVEEFEGVNEVFGFPVLSSTCLKRLNDELDSFRAQGCLTVQPNTMNRSGILLSEIPGSQACNQSPESISDPGGADIDLMSSLLDAGLKSVLTRLYPDVGPWIDSYRVFTVEYSGSEQTSDEETKDFDLAPHYDNSELTINICLDLEPETVSNAGGELFFCHFSPRHDGPWDPNKDGFAKLLGHRPGWAVVHRGSHIHGVLPFRGSALPIRRRSLICWLRSSTTRASQCPRCSRRPQLAPMLVWHRGASLDCTDLPEQAYNDGNYVRAGFADGFLLPSSQFACDIL